MTTPTDPRLADPPLVRILPGERCVKHGDELHSAHEYEPSTAARWMLQDDIGRCPYVEPVAADPDPWGALEEIEALKRERGGLHAFDENACGLCRAIEIASRALASRVRSEKP